MRSKRRPNQNRIMHLFWLTMGSVDAKYRFLHGGPLTQSVEYLPFKQRVVGSSPTRPTNSLLRVKRE
jgi:hypothetical protein